MISMVLREKNMKKSTAWLAGLMVALMIGSASGQAIKAPPVEADRSTPRGTLKVIAIAMQKGDGEALRNALVGEGADQIKLIDAMVNTAVSARKLHDAAIAAFGQEQARTLTGATEDLKYLDDAIAAIDEAGQTAIVTFADVEAKPIKLVMKGEQWAVPVGELAGGLDESATAERLDEIRNFIAVIDAVAEEITLKQHRTAEEAKQALYNRMMQAAAPDPTTQPAPTTGPATTQNIQE